MPSSPCIFLAILALFVTNGHEVEDLEGAPTELGDRAGGFFSALKTSGSFVMMQAGGFEELGDNSGETKAEVRKSIRASFDHFENTASVDQLKNMDALLKAAPQVAEMTAKVEPAQDNLSLADAEQTGYGGPTNSCPNRELAHKNQQGGIITSYDCDFKTATSCTLNKGRTLRLIRSADGENFMGGWDAGIKINSPSTPCSLVDAWAGSADSKLYVQVSLTKTMKGTKSNGRWSWTSTKTCQPATDDQANKNKFCDATNQAKLCYNGVPNLLSDKGFGAECTLF